MVEQDLNLIQFVNFQMIYLVIFQLIIIYFSLFIDFCNIFSPPFLLLILIDLPVLMASFSSQVPP